MQIKTFSLRNLIQFCHLRPKWEWPIFFVHLAILQRRSAAKLRLVKYVCVFTREEGLKQLISLCIRYLVSFSWCSLRLIIQFKIDKPIPLCHQ